MLPVQTIRIRSLILAALFLLNSAFAGSRFNTFIPTDYENPEEDRYDALRVEVPELKLEDLKDTVGKYGTKAIKKTVVYISNKRTPESVKEALAQIKKDFPDKKIEVRIFGKDGNEELSKVIRELNLKEGKQIDPEQSERIIERISKFKALLAVGARGAQLSHTGIDPGAEAVAAAAGLMTADALVNYFGTKYETEIGRAFSSHSIPFLSRFGFKGLQNFYTNNKAIRFIKGTLANFFVWGLGANSGFQYMSYHARPSQSHLADENDLYRWIGTSAIGSMVYFGSFTGLEKLRQRGWINQMGMDLFLRGNGILYSLASIPNTSGNPAVLSLFKALIGAHWGIELVPAVVGNVLPVKNDRLVLVDPHITDRNTIDHFEALEKTGSIKDLENQEKVKEYKTVNRTPYRSFVKSLLCLGSFQKAASR